MKRIYTTVWDGLGAFKMGDPTTDGSMPTTMEVAAEVYGGGLTFKGEKPSKKEHYVEGNATAKHVQMKAGAKEGILQIWADDLDKFGKLIGAKVTVTGGKAKLQSAANYTGITKALRFESAKEEGGDPVTLDFPKARLFVAENFVLNDEGVWLGDVSFTPQAPYLIDGVPVVEE